MIIGYLMDHIANAVWVQHAHSVLHLKADGAAGKLLNVEAREDVLPPPLFDENAGQFTTECVLEKQLQGYVTENLVSFCS